MSLLLQFVLYMLVGCIIMGLLVVVLWLLTFIFAEVLSFGVQLDRGINRD